jgi:RimJ/RimL family protein N-acetyltransferase
MDSISKSSDAIVSNRLVLIPLTVEFYETSLAGDREGASRLIGLEVPEDWMLSRRLMEIRLTQLQREPDLLPWLLRAIRLRDHPQMIGHIGFHSRPGAEYLSELAPGGVELGYTVYPQYQRQGYASEAAAALMDWAWQAHAVPRFVVSISPENTPSLHIAERFGFQKVGAQIDDADGPEDIFVREVLAAR